MSNIQFGRQPGVPYNRRMSQLSTISQDDILGYSNPIMWGPRGGGGLDTIYQDQMEPLRKISVPVSIALP